MNSNDWYNYNQWAQYSTPQYVYQQPVNIPVALPQTQQQNLRNEEHVVKTAAAVCAGLIGSFALGFFIGVKNSTNASTTTPPTTQMKNTTPNYY